MYACATANAIAKLAAGVAGVAGASRMIAFAFCMLSHIRFAEHLI
jgi:hypothetical protein